LAHQYSKDLNGMEQYQYYRDVTISLKKAKENGENWTFLQSDCSNTFDQ
jgi:hypothetical protein